LGIEIHHKLKWFNAVTAYLTTDEIKKIENFDFVERIEQVKTLTEKNSTINLIEKDKDFQLLGKSQDTYSLDRYPLSLGYLSGVILEKTSWDVMAYNADFCEDSEPLKTAYLDGEGFASYLSNLNNPESPLWNEIRQTIQEFRPSAAIR